MKYCRFCCPTRGAVCDMSIDILERSPPQWGHFATHSLNYWHFYSAGGPFCDTCSEILTRMLPNRLVLLHVTRNICILTISASRIRWFCYTSSEISTFMFRWRLVLRQVYWNINIYDSQEVHFATRLTEYWHLCSIGGSFCDTCTEILTILIPKGSILLHVSRNIDIFWNITVGT